jgi:hypothetical protein
MPGFVPGIHVFLSITQSVDGRRIKQDVDGRDKHGHDGFYYTRIGIRT